MTWLFNIMIAFAFAQCDMRETGKFKELIKEFESKLGRLSALVNNAGIVSEDFWPAKRGRDREVDCGKSFGTAPAHPRRHPRDDDRRSAAPS